MNTLILGGIKSGKSRLAEKLALETGLPVTLVATATDDDAEMSARIQQHKNTRPVNWTTVEEPIALGRALRTLDFPGNCVLIDCITLWLTNLLMLDNTDTLNTETDSLLDSVGSFSGQLIIVSNETSMGIIPLGDLTRRFCDEAGLIHQALASRSQSVILTVAGLAHSLKSTTT